jgi:hypothetical protein
VGGHVADFHSHIGHGMGTASRSQDLEKDRRLWFLSPDQVIFLGRGGGGPSGRFPRTPTWIR